MKSGYRAFLMFLIFPMAFGYNPVTDTLSQSFELDLLTGQSNYWTGCESPTKTMTFQEIHAGYKNKVQDRVTIHVDGGLLPTDIEPVDSYGGGKKLYGYINGGFDCDWKYLGLGVGAGTKTFLDPYLRLGSRKILYADLGFAHRFPLASSGMFTLGLGSGFGTEKLNLWVGSGGGLLSGGDAVDNSDFGGYSVNVDYRIDERFAIKFGGLKDLTGNSSSRSAWVGVRYYFK